MSETSHMPAWRSGLLILPLLLTLCFPAQAQEVEVTSGLICDTQKQVEQFIALYDGNAQDTAERETGSIFDGEQAERPAH